MTDRVRICLAGLTLVWPLLVAACGDDEPELPDVECTDGRPDFEEVTAFDKCTMCHSSGLSGDDRNGAPANVNFDTESAAEANAEKAAEEVYEGEMPPEDSNVTLTSAEEQTLYEWALCAD